MFFVEFFKVLWKNPEFLEKFQLISVFYEIWLEIFQTLMFNFTICGKMKFGIFENRTRDWKLKIFFMSWKLKQVFSKIIIILKNFALGEIFLGKIYEKETFY